MGRIFSNFKFAPYFFAFLVIFISTDAFSITIDEAKSKAAHLKISENSYWRTLLHYKNNLITGRTISLVDDHKFFLSPKGKRNPQEELFALIDKVFQENDTELRQETFCKFPLRTYFLLEQLGLSKENFELTSCTELFKTFKNLELKSISIIFPSAHINSPASMFGHTFLRIDGTNFNPLLSSAVNYSAVMVENPGMFYVVKGLFGMYSGYYSFLPYYKKVQEYGQLEFRDIWEYKLNLNEEEVQKVILHIWELKDIASDYFFFDENCSYNLLFLLEAAKPGLNLTDGFEISAIPVETVRKLQSNGLIGELTYRPSKATKIKYLSNNLSDESKNAALSLGKGLITPGEFINDTAFSQSEKLNIMDTAIEYLHSPFAKENFSKEKYRTHSIKVLSARGKLGKNTDKSLLNIPTPLQKEPLSGHSANRISFGAGMLNHKHFFDLSFRPANHDLADDVTGYPIGTEIEFLSTTIRYKPFEKSLSLNKLDLVKITSLAPRTSFFPSTSWALKTGVYNTIHSDLKYHNTFRLSGGAGLTHQSQTDNLYFFIIEGDIQASNNYNHNNSSGGAFKFGFNGDITKKLRTLITFRRAAYIVGEKLQSRTFQITLNGRISQNSAARLTFIRDKSYDYYRSEAKFSINLYF